MSIRSDVQVLDPGALVQLFVLDLTSLGSGVYRFHPGTDGQTNPIVWQGNEYLPFPVEADGFEYNGRGTLPRPKLKVANVSGVITSLVTDFDDLVGAKLTRKRTLAKYLDGQPAADPTAEFSDEEFFIERKVAETVLFVEFELASVIDLQGVMIPRRQFIRNVCTWKYRSTECGYTGGPVADINDDITNSNEDDQCGHRLASCKLRFGENNPLPFGSFPSINLLR